MQLKMMLASTLSFVATAVPPRLPRQALVVSGLDEVVLDDAPIEPSWIVSGDPRARSGLHSAANDQSASTHVWECTAGTFRWHFGWEETVLILSGSVTVTAEDGTVRTLRAGDIGYFAGGTWATWAIDDHVRKLAFCRRTMPTPLAFALRMKSAMREMLSPAA